MQDTNVTLDVGKNITNLMQQLATKLGMTVDKIFPWYVKQELITGYTFIIACLFCMITSVVMMKFLFKKTGDWNDINQYQIGYIISITILCATFIVLVFGLNQSVSSILNPEYGALRELIKDMSLLVPK